ncbi:MAG: methyltransferase domain-containing protein [Dehalococcoidia bacterium]|nr:methyltransferase domain-containing protein [Dehalococcoidia bacterium]
MTEEMYTSGEYLRKNPTWDVEDSPWKAKQIIRMMERNDIAPKSICEVGCGAGEILRQLQYHMNKECMFHGYDISPQAFELCRKRANERLHFKCKDFLQEKDAFFDLILLIDLIEHLENYFNFLREIKPRSQYKILHIPLDLSVQTVLRKSPIVKVRRRFGHMHYFTKEIALQILNDVDYEVLDWFYTAGFIELPPKSIKTYIARLPRKLFFAIHKDWAVRIMGGYSLMVLAR